MPETRIRFPLVVTCFNEIRGLPRWQADVKAQTRRPDEIVVVDSRSTDGTTEFLRHWAEEDPRVRVIVEKCSPARGHNIGNEAASGEYIVSTDMGVRLDPHWFEEIVRPFEEDSSVEVVAGSYSTDPQSVVSPAARAEHYIENGGVARLGPGFVPGNRSMAYTKKVWRELGGLPEDLTFYADDSVFGRQMLQAGYKIAYAPESMTYWSRPQRLRAFWKEQYGYGRGDGEAAIKTPIAFRLHRKGLCPRPLVPLVTGLRAVLRLRTVTGILRAVRGADLMAAAYLPALVFGQGYAFGKGYLVGDKHGAVHCLQCRARLAGYRGR